MSELLRIPELFARRFEVEELARGLEAQLAQYQRLTPNGRQPDALIGNPRERLLWG